MIKFSDSGRGALGRGGYLVLAGLVLAAAGLVGIDLWQARARVQDVAARQLASGAALASRYVFERFASLEGMIGVMEIELSAAEGKPGDLRDYAYEKMRALVGRDQALFGLFILDADGRLVATSGNARPLPVDMSDRSYFAGLKSPEAPDFLISEPLIGRFGAAEGKNFIAFARAWRSSDGIFRGAFAGTLDSIAINGVISDIIDQEDSVVSVLAEDGRFIAGDRVHSKEIEQLLAVCGQPSPGAQDVRVEGRRDMLVRCAPVEEYGLVVALELPMSAVLEGWYRELLYKSIAVALFAGLTLFALLAVAGRRRARSAEADADMLTTAIEQSTNAVIVTNRNGVIEWANMALQHQSGYALEELIGQTPRLLKSDIQPPAFYDALWRTVNAGKNWKGELVNRRKDGSLYRVRQAITPLLDSEGKPARFVAIEEDVTEMAETQAMLDRVKRIDLFTGLSNRDGFLENLDTIGRTASRYLVAVTDVMQLHLINETAGRSAGDRLLLALATRLTENHAVGFCARTGGGEFAFVLLADSRFPNLEFHIDALTTVLEEELADLEGAGSVRLRTGYAIAGEDGEDGRTLFAYAEAALRAARISESGRLMRHSATAAMLVRRRHEIRQALGLALSRGEISFMVQPQCELASGRIVGGEILVRWSHPELGPVPPDEFIPIAEQGAEIHDLGRAALRAALDIAGKPEFAADPQLCLSINASAAELSRPDFAEATLAAAEAAGIEPRRLVVELTETAATGATDTLKGQLQQLLEQGFGVEIDDFGTGYATLSQLRKLSFTGIKIDREFIAPMLEERDAKLIVQGVVAMADSLGVRVIAEGLETKGHLRSLTEMGCGVGQGYFFGKPMSPADFLEMVRRQGR